MQYTFNPANYTFKFTDDGWYDWNHKESHSQALKDRNAKALELKKQGFIVRKHTLKNQLVTRGGIGTGKPEIQLLVNVYIVNAH